MTAAHVVLAPDKFKGSLTAGQVATALAAGVTGVVDVRVVSRPVADGGDGTLDAAVAAGFDRVPVTVAGPTGSPVETAFAQRGTTAVVEMADACGLVRLPGGVPAPLTASSRGLGEVVLAALDAGCDEILLGIGGSASTDGGAGLLAALGARLIDGEGRDIPDGGAGLTRLSELDLTGLHPAVSRAQFIVACDVDNPLVGPVGAAAVYAPQKGASPEDVALLDKALHRWADVLVTARGRNHRDAFGAGAAGGVGVAALAVLNAELSAGIDLLLDLVDFDAALDGAALVVTGEGSLDKQSLRGKAPVGVARRAARHGVPVVAVCGRLLLSIDELTSAGFEAAYALLDEEPELEACLRASTPLLEKLGARIAVTYLT